MNADLIMIYQKTRVISLREYFTTDFFSLYHCKLVCDNGDLTFGGLELFHWLLEKEWLTLRID